MCRMLLKMDVLSMIVFLGLGSGIVKCVLVEVVVESSRLVRVKIMFGSDRWIWFKVCFF